MSSTKPAEELYDVAADPHQLNNLAARQEHAGRLGEMRSVLRKWMIDIRDTGLLPEADMLARANGKPPAELPESRFPVVRILDAAETVGRGAGHLPRLRQLLSDNDAAVRYWAAIGLTVLGEAAKPAVPDLRRALDDNSAPVSIAAAEALCRLGGQGSIEAFSRAFASHDACVQLQAASSVWHLGRKAQGALPALKVALAAKTQPEYQRTYFEWAAEKTLKAFGEDR